MADFVLSFVLVFALLSASDEAGDEPARWVEVLSIVAFFAMVGAYFVVGNLLGRTLGMWLVGCRVVAGNSGRRPDLWQALGRAALTIVLCFAFAWVVTADADQAGLNLLFGSLLAFSVIGRLWMLRAADRRTLFDRLSGLIVVQRPVTRSVPNVAPPASTP
jgi:uncharacterized RDD family membrane protein YckC